MSSPSPSHSRSRSYNSSSGSAAAARASDAQLRESKPFSSSKRLRRKRESAQPFIWRGLLPLLGLAAVAWLALLPFARQDIEAEVQRHVQQALLDQKMDWVQMSVSGQHVTLWGIQPEPGAGGGALALARQALCPTWLGPKACAVQVDADFQAAPRESQPRPDPVVQAAPSQPVPAPMPPPAAPLPSAQATAAALVCEREFKALIIEAGIEFETNSAAILGRSATLLDRLTRAAQGCPGRITVEGHTASIGSPAANQRLSETRANAVIQALVQRGIAANRLQARGFGDSQPVADNRTEAGRAQNHRIDFKVSAQP
jgi:outer membrane protein OmpA-like peptidoglycan-associated protein